MKAKTVTAAYLMGIRDERALLNRQRAEGDEDLVGFARACLANCQRTLRLGFSGEMAESLRGARDFWRHQVKVLTR